MIEARSIYNNLMLKSLEKTKAEECIYNYEPEDVEDAVDVKLAYDVSKVKMMHDTPEIKKLCNGIYLFGLIKFKV